MLALGLAILGSPRCLLLDEPSIGLAPNLVERLFQQVHDVCKSHAMTAILVEQNVAAAMQIADRVIIMNNGQIVFDGLPQEAREREETREEDENVALDPREGAAREEEEKRRPGVDPLGDPPGGEERRGQDEEEGGRADLAHWSAGDHLAVVDDALDDLVDVCGDDQFFAVTPNSATSSARCMNWRPPGRMPS